MSQWKLVEAEELTPTASDRPQTFGERRGRGGRRFHGGSRSHRGGRGRHNRGDFCGIYIPNTPETQIAYAQGAVAQM